MTDAAIRPNRRHGVPAAALPEDADLDERVATPVEARLVVARLPAV